MLSINLSLHREKSCLDIICLKLLLMTIELHWPLILNLHRNAMNEVCETERKILVFSFACHLQILNMANPINFNPMKIILFT